MDKYMATEQAYKNGYNRALKEFAERLKLEKFEINDIYENIFYAVETDVVDSLIMEMTMK